jgi:radical SAM superfamily enzyme YgiQ (UPF0313 family)
MKRKKRIMMIRPGKRFPRLNFAQPLGLLSLISMLRKHFPDTFDVRLVEQALYGLSNKQVGDLMAEFKPDLICFSCLTVEADALRELTILSKALFPKVPIWIGGPHASVFYDRELATGRVDAACIGEGELTFVEMIQAWLDSKPMDDIAGLAIVQDGEISFPRPRPPLEDLDMLPLPAWDLVDFRQCSKQNSFNGFVHAWPWACVLSTRGCPYHCAYCHKLFGKKLHKRSVDHVLNEIDLLVNKYGVREIHIVDDIFNLDLERAKQICDEIVARKLNIKIAFPNGLRGDRMDLELIHKLKAAGCYSITYAIETATPRIQKELRKFLKLDKVKESIARSDEAGIITTGFAMIGFPGETVEEINATIDYALDSRLLRCFFFTVVVYPRTDLFKLAQKAYPELNLEDSDFFEGDDYFKFNYFYNKPLYSVATGIDLNRIQRRAYRSFYLRPSLVFKTLIRYPKNRWLFYGAYLLLFSGFSQLASILFRFKNGAKRSSG